MSRTALNRSLSIIGLVALVGSGCGPLDTWLDAVQPHKGASGSSTGAAGSSGAAPTTVTCSADKNPNGSVCKTCVDATGKVVSTDCNAGDVPGTACVKIPDGGPTSCKPTDLWKQYGIDACAQQKLQLTDLVGGTTCGAGYQDVIYVCCSTAPGGATGTGGSGGTPPQPPKCGQTTDASGQICKTCWDPITGKEISNDCSPGSTGSGGAGGGQTCIAIDDGGPSSCKDAGTWKTYGIDRCRQQNLALTDLKLAVACEGGYSIVSYVCCGAGAAPGPVVACDSWVNPDGAVCKQCRDASGNVISLDCTGGTTPPNEICDVKTNADGSQCKTCYYSDGTMVSSCASP